MKGYPVNRSFSSWLTDYKTWAVLTTLNEYSSSTRVSTRVVAAVLVATQFAKLIRVLSSYIL